MAELFHNEPPQKIYWDRRHFSSFEEYTSALKGTTTVYVGNLSFYTTETQVKELFSKVGPVKAVIMGLDRFKKTPCGFCFVEYYSHRDCLASINYVDGTSLDDRVIRVDIDFGWRAGRQYGRGSSGGQVRDERRWTYDPARGGLGKRAERQQQQQQQRGYYWDDGNRRKRPLEDEEDAEDGAENTNTMDSSLKNPRVTRRKTSKGGEDDEDNNHDENENMKTEQEVEEGNQKEGEESSIDSRIKVEEKDAEKEPKDNNPKVDGGNDAAVTHSELGLGVQEMVEETANDGGDGNSNNTAVAAAEDEAS
mmetsp:Transcript_13816/g.23143  ORF Transcript_13816/g.23143 Transcript_13816/m.23143 type:complete len:307 (-) Transcript_13816:337-1257(-)